MNRLHFAYFALEISPIPILANEGNSSAQPLFSICQQDQMKSKMEKGFVNKQKKITPKMLHIILENNNSG